ncbi:hypothetical protein KP509_1Z123400 [Ceratopteris richardii]|nr:hypothetical protein KP509_1Z123400 [Ceratopteris richardii]
MSSSSDSDGPFQLQEENPMQLIIRKPEFTSAASDVGSPYLLGSLARSYGVGSARGGSDISDVGFPNNPVLANAEPMRNVQRSNFEGAEHRTEGEGLHSANKLEFPPKMEKERSEAPQRYAKTAGGFGKVRTSHRSNKKTPYERPGTGKHSTAGVSSRSERPPSSLSSENRSIASVIRESASRFIQISTSYIFPGFFKRHPPPVQSNGEPNGTTECVEQELHDAMLKDSTEETEELPDGPIKEIIVPASQATTSVDAKVKSIESKSTELDIDQVEEILKQKSLSREQVNRLTHILQKHESEIQDRDTTVEVEKVTEQTNIVMKDSSPVQVAQAYMGEQGAKPSIGLASVVCSPGFITNQMKSTPARSMLVDRYRSSPFSKAWTNGSGSSRIHKRSLAIDDDVAMMGSVRRVRQRMSMFPTSSPYSCSRRMSGLSKPFDRQAPSPSLQSSQTALKILETLEKLSPSPQGKVLGFKTDDSEKRLHSLDNISSGEISTGVLNETISAANMHVPDNSKAVEKNASKNTSFFSTPSVAMAKLNSKLTCTETAANVGEVHKSLTLSTPVPAPLGSSILPRGSWINVVPQEPNSDEPAKLQAQPKSSSGVNDLALVPKEEAIWSPHLSIVTSSKFDLVAPSSVSQPEPTERPTTSSASDHGTSFLLHTSPATAGYQVSAKSVSPMSCFSFPSVTLETRPVELPGSVNAGAAVSYSENELLSTKIVKPATSSICDMHSEVSEAKSTESKPPATSSLRAEVAVAAGEISSSLACVSSGILISDKRTSPISTNLHNQESPSMLKSRDKIMTESPVTAKQAEGGTIVSGSGLEGTENSVLAPSLPVPYLSEADRQQTASPFKFAFGSSGSLASVSSFSVGPSGNVSAGSSSSLASPFSFGAQSSTTFAATMSNVSPFSSVGPSGNVSAGSSSSMTSSFSFGAQSNTTFAAMMSKVSPFSTPSTGTFAFTSESSTLTTGVMSAFSAGSSSSSAADVQSTTIPRQQFGSTSKPVFGELLMPSGQSPFGALPLSLPKPCQSSAANSSPFIFGSTKTVLFGQSTESSSVTPTSGTSVIASDSAPAPASFGVSSPFKFGSSIVPSMLPSGQTLSSKSETTFSLPSFSTSAVSSMSTTSTFSFNATVPSTSSSSGSLGQGFAFNASQKNPFLSSEPDSSFKFGSAPMLSASAPVTSAGSSCALFGSSTSSSTSSSIFSFGSASTTAPSHFVFGSGQQANVSQPLTFGDQHVSASPVMGGKPDATTPPNPFASSGTQTGLGFSLGASGGDKSGRRFIKAKRIGSAKKGK